MIDLKALKEQLKLLGHDLPDDQVVAILKEMNIDFSDEPSSAADSLRGPAKTGGACDGDALFPGPSRTGSILDNFQGRPAPPQEKQQQAVTFGAAEAPQQPAATQSFNYGYTNPGHGPAPGLDHARLVSAMPPRPAPAPGQKYGVGKSPEPHAAASEYSDDCYDHDSDDADAAEEPGVSCRYCAAEAGTGGIGGDCAHQSTHQAWMERPPPSASDLAGCRSPTGAGFMQGPGDLADRFGRVTLNESAAGNASRQPRFEAIDGKPATKFMEAVRPSSAAGGPRSAGAAAAKDQYYKAHGPRHVQSSEDYGARATLPHKLGNQYEEDEESDVGLSDPDKDPHQLGGSRDLRWPPPAGLGAGAPRRAAQDPYATWLGGRGDPLAGHLAEALLAHGQLSPQESNRSIASRATSRYSTGSKRAGGAKKVDRVQRYQQLQQEWSQNRFLKQASGASRGTSRKPINFHSHFASLHAAEEVERQRMLRETRARTKKELGAAMADPTANRRDELRWQTRMRLKNQT